MSCSTPISTCFNYISLPTFLDFSNSVTMIRRPTGKGSKSGLGSEGEEAGKQRNEPTLTIWYWLTKKVWRPHRSATLQKRTHRWKEEQWSSCYSAVPCWETFGSLWNVPEILWSMGSLLGEPTRLKWAPTKPWCQKPQETPRGRVCIPQWVRAKTSLWKGLHKSELFQLLNWMCAWLVYTDRVVGEWDTVEQVDVRVWWAELMGTSEGIWWTGGEWQWSLIEMHGPGQRQCIWGQGRRGR